MPKFTDASGTVEIKDMPSLAGHLTKTLGTPVNELHILLERRAIGRNAVIYNGKEVGFTDSIPTPGPMSPAYYRYD